MVLFFEIQFSVTFEEKSLSRYKFEISVQTVKPFGCTKQVCICSCVSYISYCVSLIMVTITRHVFMIFFQTEHLLAMKFDMGNEKNMSFLVTPKSTKV